MLGMTTVGIAKDRGYWCLAKRVPRRFAHVDGRQKVTQALHIDSRREALANAPVVENRLLEAGIDYRVCAELMGHIYEFPVYGVGGFMALRRDDGDNGANAEKLAFGNEPHHSNLSTLPKLIVSYPMLSSIKENRKVGEVYTCA